MFIFYWSVPFKLALEKPLTKCDAFPDDKFRLSNLLANRKNNIGMDMGEKICTNKMFLAFSYLRLLLLTYIRDLFLSRTCIYLSI
jgi:hypothetical protein